MFVVITCSVYGASISTLHTIRRVQSTEYFYYIGYRRDIIDRLAIIKTAYILNGK
jgi:hypothetical protein